MHRQLLALTALALLACGPTHTLAPDAAVATDAHVAADAHAATDAAPIDAADVGMTDVTILWPLPTGASADPLIAVTVIGAHGALLPSSVLPSLPPLDRAQPNVPEAIRVVAMRLDPCFPGIDLHGPVACRRQIRLVAQPMRTGAEGSIAAADAAIHLLYDVDAATFDAALARIVTASRAAGVDRDAALGIHPALVARGLDGAFATELRSVILDSIGAERLVRVTSVTREPSRAPSWRFASVDVEGGAAHVTPLVALSEDAPFQTLSMTIGGRYATSPATSSPDDPSLLFDLDLARGASTTDVRAAWLAALRIEHPERHSPETIDCAGCHIAPHLRRDADTQLGLASEPSEDRFVAEGLDLDPPYPTTTGEPRERIRALGYFEREPLVSQRVMNETALVVRALRATAP